MLQVRVSGLTMLLTGPCPIPVGRLGSPTGRWTCPRYSLTLTCAMLLGPHMLFCPWQYLRIAFLSLNNFPLPSLVVAFPFSRALLVLQ